MTTLTTRSFRRRAMTSGAGWAAALVALFLMGASTANALMTPLPQDAKSTWKAPSRSARKANPVTADGQSIALGQALYTRDCLSCHGTSGKGDGPAAKDLPRHPGDLTSDAVASQSDGALFWKISMGRTPMPTFDQLLTAKQRWAVVNFVRTLAPKERLSFPRLAAPDRYRGAISRLIGNTATLTQALAADELDPSVAAAGVLAKSIGDLPDIGEQDAEEAVRTAWTADRAALQQTTGKLAASAKLQDLRAAYSDVSVVLITMVRTFGHAESAPVRVLSCPLAFDGHGATWLQTGDEAANPYLGSKHADCVETVDSLASEQEHLTGATR